MNWTEVYALGALGLEHQFVTTVPGAAPVWLAAERLRGRERSGPPPRGTGWGGSCPGRPTELSRRILHIHARRHYAHTWTCGLHQILQVSQPSVLLGARCLKWTVWTSCHNQEPKPLITSARLDWLTNPSDGYSVMKWFCFQHNSWCRVSSTGFVLFLFCFNGT